MKISRPFIIDKIEMEIIVKDLDQDIPRSRSPWKMPALCIFPINCPIVFMKFLFLRGLSESTGFKKALIYLYISRLPSIHLVIRKLPPIEKSFPKSPTAITSGDRKPFSKRILLPSIALRAPTLSEKKSVPKTPDIKKFDEYLFI